MCVSWSLGMDSLRQVNSPPCSLGQLYLQAERPLGNHVYGSCPGCRKRWRAR